MFATAHARILRLELQERIELTRGCWGSTPVFYRQRLSVAGLHCVRELHVTALGAHSPSTCAAEAKLIPYMVVVRGPNRGERQC
jgi:hypothetical protein